ncbi:MAG: fibro-slime domain-containing protein, partial [Lachnospiraceae bacterium]|nr:fibro-slime domain-containing protein [Lachnospiraceae bacterium]
TEEGTTEEETTEEGTTEEATEEEQIESVSGNEIMDEEVPLSGAMTVSLEPVTVNGITITVSGAASAFADGTTVSAVEVEPTEIVIEEAEEEEEAVIKRYKAFDINLVSNGEYVQPLNGEEIKVSFEGDLLIPDADKNEDVVVYHVAKDDAITKMEAEVVAADVNSSDNTGAVEMTTTHFSTYIIAITGEEEEVEVTINHYLAAEKEIKQDNKKPLFLSQKVTAEIGGTISDFVKGGNDFAVKEICLVERKTENTITLSDGKYTVDSDTAGSDVTLNVYYTATTDEVDNGVTMFDYEDFVNYNSREGTAYESKSINYYKNYESYVPVTYYEALKNNKNLKRWEFTNNFDKYDQQKDRKNWNGRFATKGAYQDYQTLSPNTNGESVKVNDYKTEDQIIKGLLVNLEGNDYENVKFQFEDPGFFTNEPKNGKTIYNDYSLVFKRSGSKYTLTEVKKDNGSGWSELNNFWPLDPEEHEFSDNGHNEYFGMRYDFKFQIGDYVGDLKYEFAGDDDLWVCLDGKVILDLGGIHQQVTGSVDLWTELLNNDDYDYDDKVNYLLDDKEELTEAAKKVHTITVLYMERGGSKSNCNMKFVMPNFIPKDPVITDAPKADLEIVKKEHYTEQAIEGVGFTLYSDPDCKQLKNYEKNTNQNGAVVFEGLRKGTYYLKETTYNSEKYMENDTVYRVEVTVDVNGKATATLYDGFEVVAKDSASGKYLIYNEPYASLSFKKIDGVSKDPISGVTFKLYEGANYNENDTPFKTAVSTNEGEVKFEGLKVGTEYLLVEKTPEGYVEVKTPWIVNVGYDVASGEFVSKIFNSIWDSENKKWQKDGEAYGKAVIENTPAPGSLIIKKTVNKVDDVHGVATFTFKITCPDGSILYRTITFTEDDTKESCTKSVRIANLPVGDYTVEELPTLRYKCVSDSEQTKSVEANQTTTFEYENEKCFENYYSHADVMVNKVTFTKDDEGNTIAQISMEKSSTSDEIIENQEGE